MALPFHEPRELLSPEGIDHHRAIASLIEELEAVAWYNQRAEGTEDAALRDILIHNRNEEIEHAMMLLEYLRRTFPKFNEEMGTYLFKSAPITELEALAEGEGEGPENSASSADGGSLNIGSMKKGE